MHIMGKVNLCLEQTVCPYSKVTISKIMKAINYILDKQGYKNPFKFLILQKILLNHSHYLT